MNQLQPKNQRRRVDSGLIKPSCVCVCVRGGGGGCECIVLALDYVVKTRLARIEASKM